MDFIKKAAASFSNKDKKPAEGQQQDGKKDDYVDKAFAFASKKAGFNINKDAQEKITDSGREAYEKATGKKVDPKISN